MVEELAFTEYNSDSTTGETILFLHALYSSPSEFTPAIQHIPKSYHILVVDLPGHSRSKHIPPTTISDLTDRLSSFIANHGHGGKAHLVGLSWGAYIALSLGKAHPDRVLTVFASGASMEFSGYVGVVARYLAFGAVNLALLFPHYLEKTISRHGATCPGSYLSEVAENATWRNATIVYGTLAKEYKLAPIRAKTLFVAGSKGDPVGGLKGIEDVLRNGNVESRAVVARNMGHVWDLEAPEVFGRSVDAWIRGGMLPDDLVLVEDWQKGK